MSIYKFARDVMQFINLKFAIYKYIDQFIYLYFYERKYLNCSMQFIKYLKYLNWIERFDNLIYIYNIYFFNFQSRIFEGDFKVK